MIEKDYFGLQGEKRIKKSGVRDVFTPHQPVMSVNLFFGREKEVTSIIKHLNTPGQHALLYGNRGVGKSSLANITAEVLLKNLMDSQIIKKRCDSTDNFVSVVGEILVHVGIDVHEKSVKKGSSAGANSFVSIGKNHDSESMGFSERALSPSWVAKQVSSLDALYVLDEVDALKLAEDKEKIAEFIKQLSDAGAKLKILIVGIAETPSELTAGHPSVSRCLREVPLGNMKPSELKEIITEGANKLKLKFETRVINKIVNLSSGYPHFTHLLALKSCEEAIIEERTNVNYEDLKNALHKAMEDSEGTLRTVYNQAIRSSSVEYSKILLAIALCPSFEIKAKEIRTQYETIHGSNISQGTLNNFFQRLVSDDDTAILRRLAKGIYKFNDPRMPSFIRIAQNYLK